MIWVTRSLSVIAGTGLLVGAWQMAVAQPTRQIGVLEGQMSPPVARCLIEREARIVGEWLHTLPGSPEEARLVRASEARFQACFGFLGISWNPEYDTARMRAGLVRARLQAMRDRLPLQLPGGNSQPEWYSKLLSDNSEQVNESDILAVEIGTCLARKHWNNAIKLVTIVDPKIEQASIVFGWTKQSSERREKAAADAALNEIVPFIAACVPAGTRLAIDRPRLRALVEEGIYHIAADIDPAAPKSG